MLFFIILTMVKTDLKLTQMLFFNTLFNKIDFFFLFLLVECLLCFFIVTAAITDGEVRTRTIQRKTLLGKLALWVS